MRQEIEKRLETKVVLENDANAAAMGEKWLGAGRNTDHMAMYTLGTGVGGGIVMNGRLWHGMNGMAGELGHFNVESEGHPCGCGSRGCLEQYASATAIVRMAHEAIESGEAADLARLGARQCRVHLARHLSARNSEVIRRRRRSISASDARWASVSASMINALNLPMYVIGGGVSSAWDAFAPTMFQELKVRSFIYSITAPDNVETGRNTRW